MTPDTTEVMDFDVVETEVARSEPARSLLRAHIWAAVLIALALVSIFILSRVASSPEVLGGVRESLDSQQATVSGLALGATGLSALISLVPGDALTPVADQLADVSGWFMVVIAAIILQKILVTVAGTIAFTLVIPLACALGVVYVYTRRESLRSLALRFAVFGLVLCLAVPGSIAVSTALTATYADITAAAQLADETSDDAEPGGSAGEAAPDTDAELDDRNLLESIGDWVARAAENIGDFVGESLANVNEIKDEAVNQLNMYMEQFALLVVTACVMPILVMLLFAWIIKLLFSVDIAAGRLGQSLQSQASRGVKSAGRSAQQVTSRGAGSN